MSPFQDSNAATISALAAIVGLLVGALTSSVSTWITQRHQDQRDLLAKRIFHLEQLYLDFISESARAFADAVQHDFQDPNKFIPIYTALSRIRVSSSSDVLASTERVVDQIVTLGSSPGLNFLGCEVWLRVSRDDDPLCDFSTICRGELQSLWRDLK